jgi:2-methylcitrate dehydratase PrpD
MHLTGAFAALDAFQRHLDFDDLPRDVVLEATRCLVDLIGVAAAGRTTLNASIVAGHVAETYGAGRHAARMLFDGRLVSPAGAAMAGAAAIDSLDAHDGHRLAKGHAGVVILPVLLAALDAYGPTSGKALLTRLVIGYEVATRCAIALHATTPDYHSSGAWNALGAATVLARPLGLSSAQLREALGIAEYYGPRSQMMRCIDFPTMVKDGATYGAQIGFTAAQLAARGFTGAPALTIEAPAVGAIWSDLGRRWAMTEQYLKPWPVCRWAQPAIAAAQALYPQIGSARIEQAEIATFHQAARLATKAPQTTEQAQYSLPFPVAAMLIDGQLTAASVTHKLGDPTILALAARIGVVEADACNAAFPERRLARLSLHLSDGRRLETGFVAPPGDPEDRLDRDAVDAKFIALTHEVLSAGRRDELLETTWNLEGVDGLSRWLNLLLSPIDGGSIHPSE